MEHVRKQPGRLGGLADELRRAKQRSTESASQMTFAEKSPKKGMYQPEVVHEEMSSHLEDSQIQHRASAGNTRSQQYLKPMPVSARGVGPHQPEVMTRSHKSLIMDQQQYSARGQMMIASSNSMAGSAKGSPHNHRPPTTSAAGHNNYQR
jgi:hypothetical protein